MSDESLKFNIDPEGSGESPTTLDLTSGYSLRGEVLSCDSGDERFFSWKEKNRNKNDEMFPHFKVSKISGYMVLQEADLTEWCMTNTPISAL